MPPPGVLPGPRRAETVSNVVDSFLCVPVDAIVCPAWRELVFTIQMLTLRTVKQKCTFEYALQYAFAHYSVSHCTEFDSVNKPLYINNVTMI